MTRLFLAFVLLGLAAAASTPMLARAQRHVDVDYQCSREDNRIGHIVEVSGSGRARILRSQQDISFDARPGCAILFNDRLRVDQARIRYNRCGEVLSMEGRGQRRMNERCEGRRRNDLGQPAGPTAGLERAFADLVEPPVRIDLEPNVAVINFSASAVEAFRSDIRSLDVNFSRMGSVQSLCLGNVDIVVRSEPVSSSELEFCQLREIDLVEAPLSMVAAVVVVHPANPLTSATLEELNEMWRANGARVSWPRYTDNFIASPVRFVAGDPRGPAVTAFRSRVLDGVGLRADASLVMSDAAVVAAVAEDVSAIGIIGLEAYQAAPGRVRALSIDSGVGPIAPTPVNVGEGVYPLVRPVVWYVRVDRLSRQTLRGFVSYSIANGGALAHQTGQERLNPSIYHVLSARAAEREGAIVYSDAAGPDQTLSALVHAAQHREDERQ